MHRVPENRLMAAGQGATIRVVVVDDSTFIRKAILRMLEDEPVVEVVGSAGSGEELLTHLEDWKPDVVTLDLDMPGMGGLATLDHLRAIRPIPVIILSTHSGEGAPQTIEALHRGATDFIDKQLYSLVDFEALRNVLVEKIFEVTGRPKMSEREESVGEPAQQVPPVSRSGADAGRTRAGEERPTPARRNVGAYDLVVIGASTGGPPILQTILESLGSAMPVPVLIVQHMPVGFTSAFAERLNAHLPLEVREARSSDKLLPNTVYIAPAGQQLQVRRQGQSLYTEVGPYPAHLMHTPSIDVLFESAAREVGRRTVAVLLTGMGRDGARGLAALKKKGAHTLVQDEASCVVFGMPRAAVALHAVTEIATPKNLGRRILELTAPAHDSASPSGKESGSS